jgi:hypothetical protein
VLSRNAAACASLLAAQVFWTEVTPLTTAKSRTSTAKYQPSDNRDRGRLAPST